MLANVWYAELHLKSSITTCHRRSIIHVLKQRNPSLEHSREVLFFRKVICIWTDEFCRRKEWRKCVRVCVCMNSLDSGKRAYETNTHTHTHTHKHTRQQRHHQPAGSAAMADANCSCLLHSSRQTALILLLLAAFSSSRAPQPPPFSFWFSMSSSKPFTSLSNRCSETWHDRNAPCVRMCMWCGRV